MEDIRQKLNDVYLVVRTELDGLYANIEAAEARMNKLEEKGLIYAREHWPNDKPGSLELLHFKGSPYRKKTGRKREYIGKRPGRIKAALAGIERQKEYERLSQTLQENKSQLGKIKWQIERLELVALGKQQSFWG